MASFARVFVVLAALVAPALAPGVAGATPTRDLLRCAGYSSALTAAQEALRQGDKEAALRKLREARALLSSCSRGADTASTGERAIARAPRGAAALA